MHFQIYFPGLADENPAKLEAIQRGLSAGALWHTILDRGPDGGAGCAVWWGAQSYIPGKLTWIPSIERDGSPAGAYMIGYDPQALPTPDELAWKNRFVGPEVQLGDGNEWIIPAAGMLPRVRRLTPEGRPGLLIRQEFAAYFEESAVWYDQFFNVNADSEGVSLEIDGECWSYAARALGINYRMPPELPLILGLFDTSNIIRVIVYTLQGVDINEVSEIIAKKKPGSS